MTTSMNLDNTKAFCGESWENWAKAEAVFKYIAETEEKVVKLSDAFILRHCTGFLCSGGREVVSSGEDVATILNALVSDRVLESEDDVYCTLYKLSPKARETYEIHRELAGHIEGGGLYRRCFLSLQGWREPSQSERKGMDVVETTSEHDIPLMDKLDESDNDAVAYYRAVLQVFANKLVFRDEGGNYNCRPIDAVRLTIGDILEYLCVRDFDYTYNHERRKVFRALFDLWKANIVALRSNEPFTLSPTSFMESAVEEYKDVITDSGRADPYMWDIDAQEELPTFYEVVVDKAHILDIAHKDEASKVQTSFRPTNEPK